MPDHRRPGARTDQASGVRCRIGERTTAPPRPVEYGPDSRTSTRRRSAAREARDHGRRGAGALAGRPASGAPLARVSRVREGLPTEGADSPDSPGRVTAPDPRKRPKNDPPGFTAHKPLSITHLQPFWLWFQLLFYYTGVESRGSGSAGPAGTASDERPVQKTKQPVHNFKPHGPLTKWQPSPNLMAEGPDGAPRRGAGSRTRTRRRQSSRRRTGGRPDATRRTERRAQQRLSRAADAKREPGTRERLCFVRAPGG